MRWLDVQFTRWISSRDPISYSNFFSFTEDKFIPASRRIFSFIFVQADATTFRTASLCLYNLLLGFNLIVISLKKGAKRCKSRHLKVGGSVKEGHKCLEDSVRHKFSSTVRLVNRLTAFCWNLISPWFSINKNKQSIKNDEIRLLWSIRIIIFFMSTQMTPTRPGAASAYSSYLCPRVTKSILSPRNVTLSSRESIIIS